MTHQDPHFNEDLFPYFNTDSACESGIVNLTTGLCVPVGIDVESVPECSTGVWDDEYLVCQPIGGHGVNSETGQPYPDDFPIGDLPDSCVEQWVISGSCEPIPAAAPVHEAVVVVPTNPLSVELPATGPAETLAIGVLGSLLIIAGISLRYLTSASR